MDISIEYVNNIFIYFLTKKQFKNFNIIKLKKKP